jgi:hypothetical protein
LTGLLLGSLVVAGLVRQVDPHAHRVERIVIADGRVVLDLPAVGVPVAETVRATVPADAIFDQLGSVVSPAAES